MAGKDIAAMATTRPKSVARRLWRVVRAVLFMLRRGVLPTGRKLAMDLSLLLRRGKIAGKALGGLVSSHHHHHHSGGLISSARSSFSSSCRALDPALAVHEPSRSRREVEFSCSNTPFSAAAKGRGHHHRDADDDAWYYGNYDAADVAKVFEMLNDGGHLFDDDALLASAPATATPSPALRYSSRKLRVTDSPFATSDSDSAGEHQQVDRKADEFIRRFYEQLRAQRSRAATPDSYGYAAGSYGGYSPRPVAAGIA
ncbi:hypothetical protein QYE76_021791 [Lolium multiflorum]|uniref:Avr9/Cf-9 rapidly elicited protein n=1 Tax=Lolium multiflorum TaxID=4521 RepID=A0AAD8RBD6_LOLMU|nr:hypothetical protein QYE76_021791 [Lolium multiflorum]